MSKKVVYERFLWFERQAKAKRYPNATDLARRFEVSVKTAQRDIAFMRDRLGCPLAYDRQSKGYYYQDDAFILPLTLTVDDLTSLLLAKQLLSNVMRGSVDNDLSLAIEKISVILSRNGTDPNLIDDVVSIQFTEYSPVSEKTFQTALEGCVTKRQVRIVYQSPAHVSHTERTIEPYHLYNYLGTWYLVAFCHLRREIRNFHLRRIKQISLLDQKQIRKNKFDIKRHFASSFGLYKGPLRAMVTLRLYPSKVPWLEGLVWHQQQTKKVLKDGSQEITFPVSNYAEVVMEVLRHGSGIEVIKPKELRALVKAEAQKIANLY